MLGCAGFGWEGVELLGGRWDRGGETWCGSLMETTCERLSLQLNVRLDHIRSDEREEEEELGSRCQENMSLR